MRTPQEIRSALAWLESHPPLEREGHAEVILEVLESHLKLLEAGQAELPWAAGVSVERRGDMGPERLRLTREGDGDLIVSVVSPTEPALSVQFCTGWMGGGRSPRIHEALVELWKALHAEGNPVGQPSAFDSGGRV